MERQTNIVDLPIDVIEVMIKTGELSGNDVLNFCQSDKRMLAKCLRQNQRLYRTILQVQYGITDYQGETPEDFLKMLRHDIHAAVFQESDSKLEMYGIALSSVTRLIIPDHVFEEFAHLFGFESVHQLLQDNYFWDESLLSLTLMERSLDGRFLTSLHKIGNELDLEPIFVYKNHVNVENDEVDIPILAQWLSIVEIDGKPPVAIMNIIIGGIPLSEYQRNLYKWKEQ